MANVRSASSYNGRFEGGGCDFFLKNGTTFHSSIQLVIHAHPNPT